MILLNFDACRYRVPAYEFAVETALFFCPPLNLSLFLVSLEHQLMVMGLEMQHNTNIANHIASTMSIPCKRHVGKQIPDPQLLDGKLYYYTTCHICDTKLVQCAHCDICFDPQSKTVTNYRYGIDGYYVSRHKALNRSCLSQYQPPKRHKSTHDNDECMDIENIIHTSDNNSVEVCFSTACNNDLFSISNKTPHCGDSKMNEKDDKDLFSFIRTFFSGCCWTEHSDDSEFNHSSDGSDLHVRSDHSLMSKSSDESCSNSGLSEATSNEDDESYDSGASIESWGQTNVDSNQHEENGTTHVQTQLEEIENTQYGYEDFSFFLSLTTISCTFGTYTELVNPNLYRKNHDKRQPLVTEVWFTELRKGAKQILLDWQHSWRQSYFSE